MPNETLVSDPITQPQIVMLSLDELFVPAWNPRKYIDPLEQANLRGYIERGGRTQRIEVLKAERGYWVISGQRRMLAFRQLKRTHIEAEIMDITLEEAKVMAETSNDGVKPYWLDSYENWEALLTENPDWSLRSLADKFGKDRDTVQKSAQIMKVLNPASRAMIRKDLEAQNASFGDGSDRESVTDPKNKEKLWLMNDASARQLIPLLTGRPVEEAQALAEETLKTVLKDRLPAKKVQDLVAKANGGVAKAAKTTSADKPVHAQPHHAAPQPETAASPSGISSPTGTQPASSNAKTDMGTTVPSSSLGTGTTKPHASAGGLSVGETLAWETLAGISLISQIKSKIKKGERPTFGEALLLVGHYLKKPFEWTAKHGLKGLLHGIKWVWKTLIESLKVTGIYPFARGLFYLACFAGFAWFAWQTYHYGVMRPVRIIGSRLPVVSWFFSRSPEAAAPANVSPTGDAPAVQPNSPTKTETSPTANNKHQVKRQTQPPISGISSPSVIAFVGDMATQQSELAAIAPNSPFVIKPFAYAPGAMDADMATRRLEDLQDSEKYTVRLGQDQQKVLSLVMTASNCVLTTQSGLVGLLGDTSKIEIYWEDVKEIHANVIEYGPLAQSNPAAHLVGSRQMYQLSLLATGLKKPLTVQCTSAENLERLVTALEFKLKTSRGTTAPILAMPYLYQGLRLNKDCVVTTLWADSPMDKAGLVLGDHVWSLEKNTESQSSQAQLEAGLQSLTPGPHLLYKVTAAGWKRALDDMRTNGLETIMPLRRTVHLQIE